MKKLKFLMLGLMIGSSCLAMEPSVNHPDPELKRTPAKLVDGSKEDRDPTPPKEKLTALPDGPKESTDPLDPEERRASFAELPDEILSNIITREEYKHLLPRRAISHRWLDIIDKLLSYHYEVPLKKDIQALTLLAPFPPYVKSIKLNRGLMAGMDMNPLPLTSCTFPYPQNITALDFSEQCIGNIGEWISPLCSLRVLSLFRCSIKGFEDLKYLPPSLEILNVADNPQLKNLASLPHLTKLTCLNAWNTNHKGSNDFITPFSCFINLKELNLGNCFITNPSSLSTLTQLETLDLSRNRDLDGSVFPDLPSLTDLDVNDSGPMPVSASRLGLFTNLTRLNLSCNSSFCPQGTAGILGDYLTTFTNLETLELFASGDLSGKCQFFPSSLTSLGLVDTTTVEGEIDAISRLSNLTSLWMVTKNVLREEELRLLSTLANLTDLRVRGDDAMLDSLRPSFPQLTVLRNDTLLQ